MSAKLTREALEVLRDCDMNKMPCSECLPHKPPEQACYRFQYERGELAALALRLAEALNGVTICWPLPGESANDTFERVASVFQRETGYLRPGKSYPMDCPPPADREQVWGAWFDGKIIAARALLAELEG